MTNDEQRKLELAARVMGLKFIKRDFAEGLHLLSGTWFRPHTDDGDSRRLEVACHNWIHSSEWRAALSPDVYAAQGTLEVLKHSTIITQEQYRAAVLELAAAIGEAMDAHADSFPGGKIGKGG